MAAADFIAGIVYRYFWMFNVSIVKVMMIHSWMVKSYSLSENQISTQVEAKFNIGLII